MHAAFRCLFIEWRYDFSSFVSDTQIKHSVGALISCRLQTYFVFIESFFPFLIFFICLFACVIFAFYGKSTYCASHTFPNRFICFSAKINSSSHRNRWVKRNCLGKFISVHDDNSNNVLVLPRNRSAVLWSMILFPFLYMKLFCVHWVFA